MSQDKAQQLDNAVKHDEKENTSSNSSGNRPFREVLNANLSRRRVVQGSLAGAATTFLAPAAAATWGNENAVGRRRRRGEFDLVEFDPVTIEEATAVDQTMPSISSD